MPIIFKKLHRLLVHLFITTGVKFGHKMKTFIKTNQVLHLVFLLSRVSTFLDILVRNLKG